MGEPSGLSRARVIACNLGVAEGDKTGRTAKAKLILAAFRRCLRELVPTYFARRRCPGDHGQAIHGGCPVPRRI